MGGHSAWGRWMQELGWWEIEMSTVQFLLALCSVLLTAPPLTLLQILILRWVHVNFHSCYYFPWIKSILSNLLNVAASHTALLSLTCLRCISNLSYFMGSYHTWWLKYNRKKRSRPLFTLSTSSIMMAFWLFLANYSCQGAGFEHTNTHFPIHLCYLLNSFCAVQSSIKRQCIASMPPLHTHASLGGWSLVSIVK